MDMTGPGRVDNILLALGAHGRYQILQTLLTLLGVIPSGYQLLANVFTIPFACTVDADAMFDLLQVRVHGSWRIMRSLSEKSSLENRQVPHHCARPANESAFLLQFQDLDNVTVTYDMCEITIRSNISVVRREACIFGMDYDLPADTSSVSQFDLVCERSSLAHLSQSLVIAGQGVSAVFATIISDRKGRRPVLVGSNLGMLLSGVLIAYAPNYPVFALAKFAAGGFQQAYIAVYGTHLLEMFPKEDRRLSSVLGGSTWALGCMSLALVSYLCRHFSWRTTQAVYCLSSIPFLLQFWLLDESIRWSIANGLWDKVRKVIVRAAKTNKKKIDSVLQDHMPDDSSSAFTIARLQLIAPDAAQEDAVQKMSILDVLKSRRLIINTLSIWLAWFTSAFAFFVIYMTSGALHSNIYLSHFLVSLMETPPIFFLHNGLNRFGRRSTIGFLYALMSLTIILAGIFMSLEKSQLWSILTLLSSLLAMIGASGTFTVIFPYTGEIFPTNMRNQAVGISSLVGRLGGMLAPFVSILAAHGNWAPGVLIGGSAFLVSVLMLKVLPETSGRDLPERIVDVEMWSARKKGDKQDNEII